MHRSNRRLRTRKGNAFACLLCYVIAFAIPLVWQTVALGMIYPWKLAATAPDVAAHLLDAFPFLPLDAIAAQTAEGVTPLRDVLSLRQDIWLGTLAACAAFTWFLVLVIQLFWRFTHRKAILGARQTARAIRAYRLTMLVIWLISAAMPAVLWLFGVRFIPGRTAWDFIVTFGVYPLLPIAAILVSRLAASPAISGKHAFFKRI